MNMKAVLLVKEEVSKNTKANGNVRLLQPE